MFVFLLYTFFEWNSAFFFVSKEEKTAPLSCLLGANDSNSVQDHSDFLRTDLWANERCVYLHSSIHCFFPFHRTTCRATDSQWWCLRAKNDYMNLHLLYLHCVHFLLLICNKRFTPLPSLHSSLACTLRANINFVTFQFCSHFVCISPSNLWHYNKTRENLWH